MANSSRKVRAGRAFVEFFLDDGALRRGLKMAERRIRSFALSTAQAGSQLLRGGLAGIAGFVLPARQFMAFDDAIRATAAVTSASDRDMARLNDTARELGRTTSFTAVEVANLMTVLGTAGFTPDEIIGMTSAVLDLSRATRTDATTAAGIMSATLRQFSMGAADAAHVADVLTLAANRTFNTVEGLGEAMVYAAKPAADLGLSLEETVAILGTLGNVGIQGSQAGTALRRLATLSGADAERLGKIFGISFLNADRSVKSLIDTLGAMGDATANLPSGDRMQKMNDAFGLLGITAASVMGQAAGDTRELVAVLRGLPGEANRVAIKMDSGIGGAFRRMMSAIEGTSLEIGESLGPMMEDLGEWIGAAAGDVTAFVAANRELVVALATGAAAAVAAGVALITLSLALKVVALGFAVLGAVIGLVTSPWIALAVAIASVIVWLTGAHKRFLAFAEDMIGTFKPVWDEIVAKVMSGDLTGAITMAWDAAKIAWQLGLNGLKSAWIDFAAGFKTLIQDLIDWTASAWTTVIGTIKKQVFGILPGKREFLNAQGLRLNKNPRDIARAKIEQNRAAAQLANDREAMNLKSALDKLVADSKAERELAQKKAEADKPKQPDPIPKPEAAVNAAISQGVTFGQSVAATTADAVSTTSAEGQRIMLEAIGFKTAGESTTDAVKSLESTLEDEFERSRQLAMDAPRLQGSRES